MASTLSTGEIWLLFRLTIPGQCLSLQKRVFLKRGYKKFWVKSVAGTEFNPDCCCLDLGGLEVRCHGLGPAVPLDIHRGSGGGHCGHHPAGPGSLRRPRSHWPPDVQDWSGQVLWQQVLWRTQGPVRGHTYSLLSEGVVSVFFRTFKENLWCVLMKMIEWWEEEPKRPKS